MAIVLPYSLNLPTLSDYHLIMSYTTKVKLEGKDMEQTEVSTTHLIFLMYRYISDCYWKSFPQSTLC